MAVPRVAASKRKLHHTNMQLNWRRVKRSYFEVVYLFRTAITANAEAAIRHRRTTAALITPSLQNFNCKSVRVCWCRT